MRRVIVAVTGTIAGLVALLSFRSHVPSVPAAASGPGGSSSASSAQAGSTSAGGGWTGASAGPSTATVPGEFPMGSLAADLPAGETATDGHLATTAYGPVQVQVILKNSAIVKVAILAQPANTIHDIQIGAFAFPKLISQTLAAQSANIDAVSGASYTSAGYIRSLQSALDSRA